MQCSTCLTRHNAELHAATDRLHRWMLQDLKRRLAPVAKHAKKTYARDKRWPQDYTPAINP